MSTPRLSRMLATSAAALSLAACADAQGPAADGPDDSFLAVAKADGTGLTATPDETCAILKVATIGSRDLLDKQVRLAANAAKSIVAFRTQDADDPDDDVRFTSLEQLDGVKYVGPAAFKRLLAFVQSGAGAPFACQDVSVQLLAFNDFHGALEPPTGSGGKITTDLGNPSATPPVAPTQVDAGGVEYLATLVKSLRAQNPNTLVVAAGDNIGATPLLSAAFHDEPTVESLSSLGLDVTAVGNHEFDEGVEELWRIAYGGVHADAPDAVKGWDGDGYDGASYSYLSANVIYDADGLPVFPSYTVRRFGDAWVAFIGMTLEGTPDVVTAAGVEGLSFLDEAETANALVPEIKALGIEAIVVLLHEGGAATGLYNECTGISGPIFEINKRLDPEIDVLVSGHTNAAHICNLEGRLVTSAAHNGRLVSQIELVIDEHTGDVKAAKAGNVIVRRDLAKDPQQTTIIEKWKKLVAPIANRVVATIAADITKTPNALGESALGDVIADAQLGASSGAKIAFMNPGGIRTDLVASQVSGGEKAGEVTYAELFAVQPFSNNLVLMDLTGEQLEHVLEEQWYDFGKSADRGTKAAVLQISAGFTYAVDATKPAGDRVDPASMKLDGQVIDPRATYRIVTNVFVAGGGDGFPTFKSGTNRVSGVFDLEALEQFMVKHPALTPPPLGRILAK